MISTWIKEFLDVRYLFYTKNWLGESVSAVQNSSHLFTAIISELFMFSCSFLYSAILSKYKNCPHRQTTSYTRLWKKKLENYAIECNATLQWTVKLSKVREHCLSSKMYIQFNDTFQRGVWLFKTTLFAYFSLSSFVWHTFKVLASLK